jgi:hypothetical protein
VSDSAPVVLPWYPWTIEIRRRRPFARAILIAVSTASAPEQQKCTLVSPAGAAEVIASAARAAASFGRIRVDRAC